MYICKPGKYVKCAALCQCFRTALLLLAYISDPRACSLARFPQKKFSKPKHIFEVVAPASSHRV